MSEKFQAEIEAIKTLINVLEPLDDEARQAVVDYVFRRLNLTIPNSSPPAPALPAHNPATAVPPPTAPEAGTKSVHIKELKEQKKPRSANEMAVLVGYYLSHVAPTEQRKPTFNKKDLETYFKIAEFKLPEGDLRFTLTNTKNAGYLDMAGEGEYKLNAVGYNLVVHSLPRKKNS